MAGVKIAVTTQLGKLRNSSMAQTRARFEDLGAALRSYRIVARINQAEIAAALGVSQSQISRWESGRDRPKPGNLEAIRSLVSSAGSRQRQALIHQVKISRSATILFDSVLHPLAISPLLARRNSDLARFGWLFVPDANPQFPALLGAYRKAIAHERNQLIGARLDIPFSHEGLPFHCAMDVALHQAGSELLALAEVAFAADQDNESEFSVTPITMRLLRRQQKA
ncbi:hypothetical protein GCM10011499_08680 [Pelagibacterium lentulum]|uniref:HTH cro/C1-type domain-containing protein n=2 Tax=Pelagibacterium lentulum TaxID=2029865 RepID=A0A916RAS7_9HYPH|nr:hypothetical protein GCM10011499_08680 [Pelagibacterium lentulum]